MHQESRGIFCRQSPEGRAFLRQGAHKMTQLRKSASKYVPEQQRRCMLPL